MKKYLCTLLAVLMVAFAVAGCGTEKVENKVLTLTPTDGNETITGTYTGEIKGEKPDGNGVFKFQRNGVSVTHTGGFKNGKLNGKYILQFGANAAIDGVRISKQEGVYKDGKLDGNCKTYHANGNVFIDTNYKEGKLDGVVKRYYLSGKPMSVLNYKDGKRNGTGKYFWENGSLAWEIEYPNGKGKEFYEDGQLKYEGEYKNGKHDGQGTLYNQNGSIQHKGRFVNGEPAR